MNADFYGDTVRGEKVSVYENRYTQYYDLIYYESSVTPGLRLAMRVDKPKTKGYILASTHGWHMTIPPVRADDPPTEDPYLRLHIDMRGRAFSTGKPDCNGYELIDVYDAVRYAQKHYADYLIDPDTVFYEGGSGGGGNGFALAVKFPDLFSAVTALCGISDYGEWYRHDSVGEFRDEMDPWIGCTPDENQTAYDARSGAKGVQNLIAPLFTAHGETDARVPVWQARNFVSCAEAAGKGGLVSYLELPGVGAQGHWDRATEEQMDEIDRLSEENRASSRRPLTVPERGRLTILGYLFTKHFIVLLDSPDAVGEIEYDCAAGIYRVTGAERYTLRVL